MEIRTKLTSPCTIVPLFKETILEIHIPNDLRGEVVTQWADEPYNADKEYDVIVRRAAKRRSLDANAYAWVLISKLAEKLRIPPKEAYRELVADTAYYTIVPIREDAIEEWCRRWSKNGTAWLTEDMGPCRNTTGYHNVKCWHGSSAYTQREMSAFLDLIISECNELGIPTMTPDKVEEMKKAWGELNEKDSSFTALSTKQ